jgi:SAM-dependent methyltransferase
MALSRDDLARLQRLRDLFLDDHRGEVALGDYWRDDDDLAAYDRVLGARIGWKWRAALEECHARGFARADGQLVLDYGCGSGIAARAFVARFGAGEVRCHDRAPRAAAFAAAALRRAHPGLVAGAQGSVAELRPDVLLVSHVLGELDPSGVQQLQALVRRSRRVLLVEPGNRRVARALSTLRDGVLDAFTVLAPCPHQASCPALQRADDWCHFFAAPPPEVFTDGDWARVTKALGIDQRALPYAFLCLVAKDALAPPAARGDRIVGRPFVHPHTVSLQVCRADALHAVELQKRADPQLWRTLKKAPETVRELRPGG